LEWGLLQPVAREAVCAGVLQRAEGVGPNRELRTGAAGGHGGDLNGFILVKAEEGKLDAVQHSEKFLDLITKVALNVDGVGVIRGWSGESMMNQVPRYAKVLS
jgi:hypothetical protein